MKNHNIIYSVNFDVQCDIIHAKKKIEFFFSINNSWNISSENDQKYLKKWKKKNIMTKTLKIRNYGNNFCMNKRIKQPCTSYYCESVAAKYNASRTLALMEALSLMIVAANL